MWKVSPFLLPSLCFGTMSEALLGKELLCKDGSILCCFVIRSGLKIQAQLLHHCDLMTFSKCKCFELLWFQEQEKQWLIKSSVFKIRNKVRGMQQKAKETAGNIDSKSLQVLGSTSSSQCPGKAFNFLIAFFFFLIISQYHHIILREDMILVFPIFIYSTDYAITDKLLLLKDLCLVVWRCNTQVGVVGQKWKCLCPPLLEVRAGNGRSKQSSWLMATGPVVRHTSMPERTGSVLPLKMNHKSRSIGLSSLKNQTCGVLAFFSGEHPRHLFHAERLPAQHTVFIQALCEGWIGQVLRIVL